MIFGVVTFACRPGRLSIAFGQRVQDDGVVEALRGGQVPLLAGDRVQVGQCLRQPAELGLQDHLHLVVREPAGPPVHPVGQLLRHVEGLVVACQLVLVDHPGQVLVDHVVRRPDRLALLQDVEVALGERGQVAGVETPARGLRLERGELADQVPAAALRVAVTGVGVGERETGQQVAGHVAADLRVGLLPAAERLGGGGLTVVEAEGAEHPFGVEEQQVGGVPGLVLAERAVEQLDRIEGQGRGPARGAVGGVAAGFGGRGPGLGRRDPPAAGDSVGDQGLFGDQGAGADAEHGERPAPAQALAGLRLGRLWPAGPGSGLGLGLDLIRGFRIRSRLGLRGSGAFPLPSTFFKSEVLCPVSTLRKIVSRGTCPCNRPSPGPGSSPRA